MITVTVRRRQTLSDICLQVYGTLEGIMALARANGLAASEELQPGLVNIPHGTEVCQKY